MKSGIENITIHHAPITLTGDLGDEPHFRYWRMSVSILSSESVEKEIKQSLKEYLQINDNDVTINSVGRRESSDKGGNNRNII